MENIGFIKCYFCKKVVKDSIEDIFIGSVVIEIRRLEIPYCDDCFESFLKFSKDLKNKYVNLSDYDEAKKYADKIRAEINDDEDNL